MSTYKYFTIFLFLFLGIVWLFASLLGQTIILTHIDTYRQPKISNTLDVHILTQGEHAKVPVPESNPQPFCYQVAASFSFWLISRT